MQKADEHWQGETGGLKTGKNMQTSFMGGPYQQSKWMNTVNHGGQLAPNPSNTDQGNYPFEQFVYSNLPIVFYQLFYRLVTYPPLPILVFCFSIYAVALDRSFLRNI